MSYFSLQFQTKKLHYQYTITQQMYFDAFPDTDTEYSVWLQDKNYNSHPEFYLVIYVNPSTRKWSNTRVQNL